MPVRTRSITTAAAAVLAAATAATHAADPVIDGTADASYGPAVVTQTIQTGFGNNDGVTVGGQPNPNPHLFAGGSELDAAYSRISGGYLYLFLAGNLETNFNKLDIFIDSVAGGQNRLRNDFVPGNVDFGNPNHMGGDGTITGLRFDTGFAPDYYIALAAGGGDPVANTPPTLYANYAAFTADAPGTGRFMGGSNTFQLVDNDPNNPGVSPTGIEIALDNANSAGVTGGPGAPSSGTGVTTGAELKIPLSAIGNPTGPIKVTAFINNDHHDYLANQVLGSLPDNTNNLGSDNFGGFVDSNSSAIDFQLFAGDQFFTVPGATVVEPGDLNGDHIVDLGDINYVTARWLNTGTPGSLDGDANGDGVVDLGDINYITARWLNTGEPSGIATLGAVPEPASLSLLTLAATGLVARRRRK